MGCIGKRKKRRQRKKEGTQFNNEGQKYEGLNLKQDWWKLKANNG